MNEKKYKYNFIFVKIKKIIKMRKSGTKIEIQSNNAWINKVKNNSFGKLSRILD